MRGDGATGLKKQILSSNREVFNNHAKSERLDEALAILEKAGAACPKREETGGRSRELWIPLIAAK
jgi:hypothetical protein